MADLLSLLQELILYTMTTYLGLSDSVHLIQTCKSLYSCSNVKLFWIHLLRCAHRLRPVPAHTDWGQSSIEEIRDNVQSAYILNRMMVQKSLPNPRRVITLELDTVGGFDWVWLLRDGTHLITVSHDGILMLWNIPSKEVLASIKLERRVGCCDWVAHSDALTIIINQDMPSGSLGPAQVWRYEWASKKLEMVVQQDFDGEAVGNFARDDLIGFVARDESGEHFVYALNIVTLKEAKIIINLPGSRRSIQSTLTSPTSLFFYSETTESSVYYSLALEDISMELSLSTPMREASLSPLVIWLFQFDPTEITMDAAWSARCRYMWDGRMGTFSRSWQDPQIVTLSLIDPRPSNPTEMPTVAMVNTYPIILRAAHRILIRHIPSPGIASSERGWDLWNVGIFAKGMAWLEYPEDGDPFMTQHQQIGKICFAEFPPVEDETHWSLPALSPDISGVNEDSGVPVLENEETIVESKWPRPTSSVISTTGEENDREEVDQRAGSSSGFGHVVEYAFESGWAESYGGIYSMDWDESRGRVAFATGSGKVLIYEFI